MALNELDVVVSLAPLESGQIAVGAIGTIVHVFTTPSEAYLVDFSNELGETIALITVLPEQIKIRQL